MLATDDRAAVALLDQATGAELVQRSQPRQPASKPTWWPGAEGRAIPASPRERLRSEVAMDRSSTPRGPGAWLESVGVAG